MRVDGGLVENKDQDSEKYERTFTFTFDNGKNQMKTLKLQVDIMEPQDCVELTARVACHHKIPCFIEPELTNALRNFIEKEKIKVSDEEATARVSSLKEKPEDLSKIAKSVATKYKKTWAQFTKVEKLDEREEFSTMYHKLIHSKAMTLLLSLEEHYYIGVQKILSDQQISMTRLRERQELEMQRTCEHVSSGSLYTEDDVNNLAAKHAGDSERLANEWRAKYDRLVLNQKKEYRGVVSRLYEEMLANNGEVDENALTYIEVKKVVEVSERTKEMQLNKASKNTGVYESSPGRRSHHRQKDNQHNGDMHLTVDESLPVREEYFPRLEESFTINLGAQMKTMHNIRLVAAPILHFCRHSNQSGDLQAQRLQTILSLYSNSLSGLVLLVDNNIDSISAVKAEFASVCEGSTEFHFPSYDEQLQDVKYKKSLTCHDRTLSKSDDTASVDSSSSGRSFGEGQFQEGDIYVTKHSNLSRVHVIFHLVANTAALKSPESSATVSSRHPSILGLRHILKLMSSHDVSTLMIPILLCHELSERVDDAWIVKRAELAMKCMKGFMMEMATWDGGISRTIQFVLPPDISEQAFYRLSSMLPEIFRTTSARNLTSPRKSKNTANSPKPSGH